MPFAGELTAPIMDFTTGHNPRASGSGWVTGGFALRRPMIATPGTRRIYSTGTTHVLGAALIVATGQTLLEQARAVLGRPLGIEIPTWTRDSQGYYFGGNELALTPRAMLMRDDGRFDGEQVISSDRIRASIRRHKARPIRASTMAMAGP